MKKIITVMSIMAIAACNTKPVNIPVAAIVDTIPCPTDNVVIHDTLYAKSNNHIFDSLVKDNKKLSQELANARLIISNVKYYVNLAEKNPSQQKFLIGWLKRPLSVK